MQRNANSVTCYLVERCDRAAGRYAQPEYVVAGRGGEGVPEPRLLHHGDPGLRGEQDQHAGTDVALSRMLSGSKISI